MGRSNYQTLWTLNIVNVHTHQTFEHRRPLKEENINKHSSIKIQSVNTNKQKSHINIYTQGN
jgi:hypothetical protein